MYAFYFACLFLFFKCSLILFTLFMHAYVNTLSACMYSILHVHFYFLFYLLYLCMHTLLHSLHACILFCMCIFIYFIFNFNVILLSTFISAHIHACVLFLFDFIYSVKSPEIWRNSLWKPVWIVYTHVIHSVI